MYLNTSIQANEYRKINVQLLHKMYLIFLLDKKYRKGENIYERRIQDYIKYGR